MVAFLSSSFASSEVAFVFLVVTVRRHQNVRHPIVVVPRQRKIVSRLAEYLLDPAALAAATPAAAAAADETLETGSEVLDADPVRTGAGRTSDRRLLFVAGGGRSLSARFPLLPHPLVTRLAQLGRIDGPEHHDVQLQKAFLWQDDHLGYDPQDPHRYHVESDEDGDGDADPVGVHALAACGGLDRRGGFVDRTSLQVLLAREEAERRARGCREQEQDVDDEEEESS